MCLEENQFNLNKDLGTRYYCYTVECRRTSRVIKYKWKRRSAVFCSMLEIFIFVEQLHVEETAVSLYEVGGDSLQFIQI